MMRLIVITLSLQLAASLQYKSSQAQLMQVESEIEEQFAENETPECNGCKYAYITMWIAEGDLPAQMRKFKAEASSEVTAETLANMGVLSDSTEKDLLLSDKAVSDSMSFEADLGAVTTHLSGKDAIFELAGNLQKVGSKYPLIILTNEKNGILLEQEDIKAKYPNIEIVELQNYLYPKCTMRKSTITHFQKLNVLGMQQYDKLLWIDLDVRLRKSIDHTFKLDVESTTRFMKNDWYCGNQPLVNGGYSSSLMLFKPNKKLLQHVVAVSDKMGDCGGEDSFIQKAFKQQWVDEQGQSRNMNMKWFQDTTVRYPQCDERHETDAIHFVKAQKGYEQIEPEMSKSDM